ncbi:MAG TPA: hypothetical protein VHY09_07670 [Candidatus Methylacidiphilales bacterium]|jgi:hypothetical protein|nr:hypothetical protein [Candidatus Methylacidiphilales bacterium]
MNPRRSSWFLAAGMLCLTLSAAVFANRGQARALAVSYQMPADGELTLGLYTRDGALLRWLVQDDFRRSGENRATWDGLDQWGHRVPAGDYVLRGIYHAPLSADYQLTVANPGTPPWPTRDGRGDWLSDEGNPQAVASDGDGIYLGAPNSEKGFTVIGLDDTGKRQWGTNEPRHSYPRSVSLAVDGDYLYALYSGPYRENADATPYAGRDAIGRALLYCMNKRTGDAARFSRWNPILPVATWPYHEQPIWLWNLRNQHAFTPASYGGQPRYACLDLGEPTNAIGLAAVGDRLYASLLFDNKLIEIDPASGKPTGRDIPLNAPAGLCRLDDQTLLAVSGRAVVKVNVKSGGITPLVSTGLAAPDDLATDTQGNIYVSDWADSFQVKVFNANGEFLHAIGKPEGRPWSGAWDASGMLVPRGIAVTPRGELWVAEDDGTPPRVSVWNAATGAFVRDYIGPAPYGGGTYFWMSPSDPAEVHVLGTRFRIDAANKTWTPEAVEFRRAGDDDPFMPNGHDLGPHPQVRVLSHDGHEYIAVNTMPGLLSILQRQGDGYRAVAALGQAHHDYSSAMNGDGTERTDWDSDVGRRRYDGYFPSFFRGHGGDSFSWSDANGDFRVQPEEMRWQARSGKLGLWGAGWGVDLSREWSFFFAAQAGKREAVFRLDPQGWTPAGAPVYDMAQARPILFLEPGEGISGLHVTGDDKLIVSLGYEFTHNRDSIAAYGLEGRKLWAVAMPKRLTREALVANNAIYDFQLTHLGDVVCTWAYHGNYRPQFFTSDGLYVGTLLQDTPLQRSLQFLGASICDYVGTPLDDAAEGPQALWSESAKYFYQGPGGELELINGGNQAEHFFAIRGLEAKSLGRFETACRVP